MFANWLIDGLKHCFNKNWYGRQKCGFLRNTQDLLYSKKSKCISSPEQNYFSHFAMRYPVQQKIPPLHCKTGLVKTHFGAPDNDMMLVAVIKTNYGVIYKISGMQMRCNLQSACIYFWENCLREKLVSHKLASAFKLEMLDMK